MHASYFYDRILCRNSLKERLVMNKEGKARAVIERT